jgi:hypothetical protein
MAQNAVVGHVKTGSLLPPFFKAEKRQQLSRWRQAIGAFHELILDYDTLSKLASHCPDRLLPLVGSLLMEQLISPILQMGVPPIGASLALV